MIFAKIDVALPRHYRLIDVRPGCVRVLLESQSVHGADADACARIARAAALGVWTAVLCYTREQMLDGFCPWAAIRDIATDAIVDELVAQGLLARADQDGRHGVVILNYAKHNETKGDIQRRMNVDRSRKKPGGPSRAGKPGTTGPGRTQLDVAGEAQSAEPKPQQGSPPPEASARPQQLPPARPEVAGDHQALIAHFVAEFERLKGAKPEIGGKGGAGAKKLLDGRTLAEAKAIVDRALSDPWWLDKNPDLAAIAGKINSFIGRQAPTAAGRQALVQPGGGSWKKAGVTS